MFTLKSNVVTLLSLVIIIASFNATLLDAFDDEDIDQHHGHEQENHGKLPKDKILLKNVKTLTFQRNKRTTAKRTHSIPQLSCVGGTAGCKLFTPNEVECENHGFDKEKVKFSWRCHAEMSDRVTFNHVEVICEGYDYPEDDYILLGSCGLEFTLDYADPNDFHHHSYFHHMDDHEKELHREKVQEKKQQQQGPKRPESHGLAQQLIKLLRDNLLIVGAIFSLGCFIVISLIRLYFPKGRQVGVRVAGPRKQNQQRGGLSYEPLSSAISTSKKAC